MALLDVADPTRCARNNAIRDLLGHFNSPVSCVKGGKGLICVVRT